MRDLEFLPEWYPRLRRRRRILLLQGWTAAALVGGMGLWMFLAAKNVAEARACKRSVDRQIAQTTTELEKLNDLLRLQKECQEQAKVVSTLGPHVSAALLLKTLEGLMPPEMAVVSLAAERVDDPRQATGLAAAAAAARGADAAYNRRLKIRVQGVAPTDVELGNFLAKLTTVPYFSDIAMTYARDRSQSGHLMREFEVTFNLNMTEQGGQ